MACSLKKLRNRTYRTSDLEVATEGMLTAKVQANMRARNSFITPAPVGKSGSQTEYLPEHFVEAVLIAEMGSYGFTVETAKQIIFKRCQFYKFDQTDGAVWEVDVPPAIFELPEFNESGQYYWVIYFDPARPAHGRQQPIVNSVVVRHGDEASVKDFISPLARFAVVLNVTLILELALQRLDQEEATDR